MDCIHAEERMSAYLESALPPGEARLLEEHLAGCGDCAALLGRMRAVVDACGRFPVLEPDPALLDRILLATSGRPRSRSFSEWVRTLWRPLMTPRLAMGSGLVLLCLALALQLGMPRLADSWSSVSALGVLGVVDRGVQSVYSRSLRVNDRAGAWLAEFRFFRDNAFNRIRFLKERLDAPAQSSGEQSSGEPGGRQEREGPAGEKAEARRARQLA
jgi:anti-sigma factor RsiW